MRGLNPDQLRTFIEVIGLGSFTAASKRLNLSQPAVSLQIRELEARCGVQLLERHGRKPHPTDAGRVLLAHARRILQENEDALLALRQLRDSTGHRVRIGMTTVTLACLADDVIRQFRQCQPDIDLSITLDNSPVLADQVRNQHLDLAIVSLPIEDACLAIEPFHTDEVVGIVPADVGRAPPRVMSPEILASAPFVVQTIGDTQTTLAINWLRLHGLTPQGFIEVRTLEACRAAVAAGLGVSIVPGVMMREPVKGLVALALEPRMYREVALISRRGMTMTADIQQVRDALLQCRGGEDQAGKALTISPAATLQCGAVSVTAAVAKGQRRTAPDRSSVRSKSRVGGNRTSAQPYVE